MFLAVGTVGKKRGWGGGVLQVQGKGPATDVQRPRFLSPKTILTRSVIMV